MRVLYPPCLLTSPIALVPELSLQQRCLPPPARPCLYLWQTLCKSELRDLFALHADLHSHLHHKLVEQGTIGDGNRDSADDNDDESDSDVEEVQVVAGGNGEAKAPKAKAEARPPPKPPKPVTSAEVEKAQEGWPKETGDLHLWGHHLGCETVDDAILRDAGRRGGPDDGYISFVFSLQVRLLSRLEHACAACL